MHPAVSTIFEFETISCHKWSAASIRRPTYDWLETAALKPPLNSALTIASENGQRCLKAKNYVGVIQAPTGEAIEILPKVGSSLGGIAEARRTLLHLLRHSGFISSVEAGTANIHQANAPLHEVFIGGFLSSLAELTRKGIKSSYVTTAQDSAFLKGKLRVADQLRKTGAAMNRFAVTFDEFLINRPENRVIKTALFHCSRMTRNAKNAQKISELDFALTNVPTSVNWREDCARYTGGRDMTHYKKTLEWAELILQGLNPLSTQGRWEATSLLFPMERVFERFVLAQLRRHARSGVEVQYQPKYRYLTSFSEQPWFRLEPDFILRSSESIAVLDTKWKILDANLCNSKDKMGLSHDDIYQLFVYASTYLSGAGELFLIYPAHSGFSKPLEHPLRFGSAPDLKLWIVPFPLRDISTSQWDVPDSDFICRAIQHTRQMTPEVSAAT